MLKFFKNKVIKHHIAKNLKTMAFSGGFDPSQIQKIGCIVDFDQISEAYFLEELVKFYQVRSENALLLGYKENPSEETHIKGVPLFAWKDISYSGKIHNYHADRLSELEFDILINYFDTPKLPLLLLSSQVKAKLRVGFQGLPLQYNDIILQMPLSKETLFVEEVKKLIPLIR